MPQDPAKKGARLSNEEVLGHLAQRVSDIHTKIEELTNQRADIDRKLRIYEELAVYYNSVHKAEHGMLSLSEGHDISDALATARTAVDKLGETPLVENVNQAVAEILKNGETMSAGQIAEAIRREFPAVAANVRALETVVAVTLHRRCRRGVTERVGRNAYHQKPDPDWQTVLQGLSHRDKLVTIAKHYGGKLVLSKASELLFALGFTRATKREKADITFRVLMRELVVDGVFKKLTEDEFRLVEPIAPSSKGSRQLGGNKRRKTRFDTFPAIDSRARGTEESVTLSR